MIFSNKESKSNLWGFVYMKEDFDFIFDINLVVNYTTTVLIPVPKEGPACFNGSEGYCRNIIRKHGNNVSDEALFCQRSVLGNYWNTSMCYQMRKANCAVYSCQPRDIPGVTPADWTYCKGDSFMPCQKRNYIYVPEDSMNNSSKYSTNDSRGLLTQLAFIVFAVMLQ